MPTTEKMLDRYCRYGHNRDEARQLLEETLNTRADKNLASALAYLGFITDYQADKMMKIA